MSPSTENYHRTQAAYTAGMVSSEQLPSRPSTSSRSGSLTYARSPSHHQERFSPEESKWNPFPNKTPAQADAATQGQDHTRWFSNIRDWLSISEPSAQAMKSHKKTMYGQHGVELGDKRAAAKMHFPLGRVPKDAITSTRGPDPETALKHRARQRLSRLSFAEMNDTSNSLGSRISTSPSVKADDYAWPWGK